MTQAKEIIFEEEALNYLAKGINKLANVVRSTLGPKGKNVGLERSYGAPQITNDGNSIVKEVELKDQYEQMGVEMAKEVAAKIKDKCGDGTTTGTLLLDALVQEGTKYVVAGASPISLKRGMEKAVEAVVSELERKAIPVKSQEEIKNIATVSASGNQDIGNFIAQAIEKVGREGVVTIEEAKGTETIIETVDGMQFDRGYISAYFCTQQDKMIVEMENPVILVTDKKISSIQEILTVLQGIATSGQELLIICDDLEADALATLVVNKLRGILKVAAVKAPGFGDRRKAMLQDIAILTGATLISEEAGILLKDAKVEQLGKAGKVLITKEHTTLVDGKGDASAIALRIKQLGNECENSSSSYDKEKLQERKAKLKGGVAVIRVGAATEPELKQKKQMFEDSLNSTKAALEQGIVAGGGVALLRAKKAIEKLSLSKEEAMGAAIIAKACEMPAKQIAINSGADGSVIISHLNQAADNEGYNALTGKIENLIHVGVLDPVKMVINCILHANSVAGIVLMSKALIGDAPVEEKSA